MDNVNFINQLCKDLKRLKHAKLTPNRSKALKMHRNQIRQLWSTKSGLSKRRHVLTQSRGGFLKSIFRSIPVVGSVIESVERIYLKSVALIAFNIQVMVFCFC